MDKIEAYLLEARGPVTTSTDKWSADATKKLKHHTPTGMYIGSAKAIVARALKDARGNPHKALSRITFYINRGGSKLANSAELNKAKEMLSKKAAIKVKQI